MFIDEFVYIKLQVGLIGEESKIYTQEGSTKSDWTTIESSLNQPLIWYKVTDICQYVDLNLKMNPILMNTVLNIMQTTFDAPSGTDPVALNLASMGKGEAWVNGESIGRYWVSFKTPTGQPSQSL